MLELPLLKAPTPILQHLYATLAHPSIFPNVSSVLSIHALNMTTSFMSITHIHKCYSRLGLILQLCSHESIDALTMLPCNATVRTASDSSSSKVAHNSDIARILAPRIKVPAQVHSPLALATAASLVTLAQLAQEEKSAGRSRVFRERGGEGGGMA